MKRGFSVFGLLFNVMKGMSHVFKTVEFLWKFCQLVKGGVVVVLQLGMVIISNTEKQKTPFATYLKSHEP